MFWTLHEYLQPAFKLLSSSIFMFSENEKSTGCTLESSTKQFLWLNGAQKIFFRQYDQHSLPKKFSALWDKKHSGIFAKLALRSVLGSGWLALLTSSSTPDVGHDDFGKEDPFRFHAQNLTQVDCDGGDEQNGGNVVETGRQSGSSETQDVDDRPCLSFGETQSNHGQVIEKTTLRKHSH